MLSENSSLLLSRNRNGTKKINQKPSSGRSQENEMLYQKYVNRRTSRMTQGERQVKPRRKYVNLKILSNIQKRSKTVIPKMKTKRKEKEEKKEETKIKEARRMYFCPESNSGPLKHRINALTTRPRETQREHVWKSSSVINHEFKNIFQKNDCSLDSENPNNCISSHLHVKNRSPTVQADMVETRVRAKRVLLPRWSIQKRFCFALR